MNLTERTCNETILLVDDDPHILSMLKDVLTRHGYKVIQAVDGQDALDIFKQDPHGISLVLTDILMPRMGGACSFQEMSKLNPLVKVIFMSGCFTEQLQPELKVIMKPFSPMEIVQAIGEILGC